LGRSYHSDAARPRQRFAAPEGDALIRSEALVSTDKDHLSLPRLYGAPPHGPRRMGVEPTPPPLGPDDLPIERFRSPEEQQQAMELFPRAYTSQVIQAGPEPFRSLRPVERPQQLRGRPLLLRALAGRLLRPKGN
jgi:hypothetical protein